MKRSLFRLLTCSLLIFALVFFASAVYAQGKGKGGGGNNGGEDPPPTLPFEYRLEYASVEEGQLPNDVIGAGVRNVVRVSNGNDQDGIYVVGTYSSLVRTGTRGFIYIRFDNGTSEFIDMPERVGLQDSEFSTASCNDINSSGIVVGGIVDSNNLVHPVYFNLFESENPQLHYLRDDFPGEIPPPSEDIITGRCINAVGDIFVDYYVRVVVNPFAQQFYPIPIETPSPRLTANDMNDLGTVLGSFNDETGQTIMFRYNIHDTNHLGEPDPSAVEYFSQFTPIGDPKINNLDEFCVRQDVPGGKPRNREKQYAVRYSTGVDWSSSPVEALSADSINDAGDICGEDTSWDGGYFHYSIREIADGGVEVDTGPTVDLQSLMTDDFFVTGSLYRMRLLNRIELSPTLSAPILCGSIRNRNYSNEHRLFFLVPYLP